VQGERAEHEREHHVHRAVLLQACGEGKPLFIFPGSSGSPLSFADLASRLGRNRPVYAFHSVGIQSECEPVRRMEPLARLYVAEILDHQPSGPYFLFGYSVGGVLAFEAARELLSRGERVAVVIMADCAAPGYPRLAPWQVRARAHLRNLVTLSPRARLHYLQERLARRTDRVLTWLEVTPILRERQATALLAQSVDEALDEAYDHYRPAALSTHVLFITADTPPDWPATDFDDPLMGWGPVFRGHTAQCHVPGTHLSIFDPDNVPVLAERVSEALSQAEAGYAAEAD
jgi:thioesterase domain-containing protein